MENAPLSTRYQREEKQGLALHVKAMVRRVVTDSVRKSMIYSGKTAGRCIGKK
jgi:hypothetical protein